MNANICASYVKTTQKSIQEYILLTLPHSGLVLELKQAAAIALTA